MVTMLKKMVLGSSEFTLLASATVLFVFVIVHMEINRWHFFWGDLHMTGHAFPKEK